MAGAGESAAGLRRGGSVAAHRLQHTCHTIMNIASILRHWFTLAATIFTAWVIAMVALPPEQQQLLSTAVTDLVGPLVILCTLLVTALGRMALVWISKTFRAGSGDMENDGSPSGGMGLLVLGGAVAALCGGLPSCSAEQLAAARSIPIKTCVVTDQGTICYSSKSGLSAEIDATSGK